MNKSDKNREFKSPFDNTDYRRGWTIFNQILVGYIVILFLVAEFRSMR